MISDLIEMIVFDVRIVVSFAVAMPLGWAVGSYLGVLTGLATFGAAFVAVLFVLLARAWLKRR